METIRELIESYSDNEDKAILGKILELLKTEENIYSVLVRATNNFYMGIEYDKPTAYVFTGREYADNFTREVKWEGIQAKYIEVKPEQRSSFFSDLYRSGIEAVAINKGEDNLVMSLLGIIDKPEDDSAIINPSLIRAGNQFYQALSKKKAVKPMQDLMCREIHKATFLAPLEPVKEGEGRHILERDEKTAFAFLTNQDSKKFLPIFTDWKEFSKYDKKMRHDAVLLTFPQLRKLIRKVEGIALNPFGFNLILDQEKIDAIESTASAETGKIISLSDRR